MSELSIIESISIGVAAGAAGAGGLGWFMVRKALSEMEEKFVTTSKCESQQELNQLRSDTLFMAINNLDAKVEQSMNENKEQHKLIIKMLESRGT